MNLKTFKHNYLHTLQKDPQTNKSHVKIPIENLNQLLYMQESLLEGIKIISQLEQRRYKEEHIQSIQYWLSKILLDSYPKTELDGLSEWLSGIE